MLLQYFVSSHTARIVVILAWGLALALSIDSCSHVSFLESCYLPFFPTQLLSPNVYVSYQVAINGPGWKMMLVLRQQRNMVFLKRVVAGWLSVTKHDKARVLLPMFVGKREHREMLLHFQSWQSVRLQGGD